MAVHRCVKDVMISLSEYAVVSEDATLADAARALEEAQAKLTPGRQPHRAVLVRSARGEICGKVGHLAFLRALLPERKPLFTGELFERAGVSDAMVAAASETLDLLGEDLVDLCERARNVRVGDVCTAATAEIDEGASLFEAIQVLASQQTLSLIVKRGSQTVGLLRISDLFDEIARIVRENECADGEE